MKRNETKRAKGQLDFEESARPKESRFFSSRLTDPRPLLDLRPSQRPLLFNVVEKQEHHRLVETDAEVFGSERETSLEVEREELVSPREESTLVGGGVELLETVESGVELEMVKG